ncbi:aspartate kinase [Cytophagales bacterium LB-30]|uniref:Aspartokinase n=1 Tax=Shiella aurantiaca TaxID=3058365 RepID=A0ABT8F605_9BACT|nr:aspartate kinase [Shiella aurantiaca]MDN4165818.1 aspartate kinase [Shiella aurantiaca]
MKVVKFGGTSVGSAQRMKHVANLISQDSTPKIIVLSAVSGTTNSLVAIAESIEKGKPEEALQKIVQLKTSYEVLVSELVSQTATQQKAQAILEEHFGLLEAQAKMVYSDSMQRLIVAQGELLSTKLFMLYLEEAQIAAEWWYAPDFMQIDSFKEPLIPQLRAGVMDKVKASPQHLFITQGFICVNEKGEIDNLKRGGSDYSATLIGAAISAEEVQIWTDIDGMHNNDPRVVENTYPIAELSFDEASELAYFGAKILHPSSIWPVQKFNVPVRLLNTMQPEARGTYISAKTGQEEVKALAAKDGITAIKIKSSRMILAYGFLRKIFEIFENYRTSIDMITTSEVAVSVTIDDNTYIEPILAELQKLGTVEVDYNQTIVCIVGNLVADSKGIVKKVFDSLEDIPVRMISYGGSKNNISLLVDVSQKVKALKQLNKGLFQN